MKPLMGIEKCSYALCRFCKRCTTPECRQHAEAMRAEATGKWECHCSFEEEWQCDISEFTLNLDSQSTLTGSGVDATGDYTLRGLIQRYKTVDLEQERRSSTDARWKFSGTLHEDANGFVMEGRWLRVGFVAGRRLNGAPVPGRVHLHRARPEPGLPQGEAPAAAAGAPSSSSSRRRGPVWRARRSR